MNKIKQIIPAVIGLILTLLVLYYAVTSWECNIANRFCEDEIIDVVDKSEILIDVLTGTGQNP